MSTCGQSHLRVRDRASGEKSGNRSGTNASTPRTDHKQNWHSTCNSRCRDMASVRLATSSFWIRLSKVRRC